MMSPESQALAVVIAEMCALSRMDRVHVMGALQLVITELAGDEQLVNFCGHCQSGYRTPEEARRCARECREKQIRAAPGA